MVRQMSGRASEQVGIALQIQRPALIAGNTVEHALPAIDMAVQLPMLELDAGPACRLGDEPHLIIVSNGTDHHRLDDVGPASVDHLEHIGKAIRQTDPSRRSVLRCAARAAGSGR